MGSVEAERILHVFDFASQLVQLLPENVTVLAFLLHLEDQGLSFLAGLFYFVGQILFEDGEFAGEVRL